MYRFHVIILFRITSRYLTESLFGIGILFMITCGRDCFRNVKRLEMNNKISLKGRICYLFDIPLRKFRMSVVDVQATRIWRPNKITKLPEMKLLRFLLGDPPTAIKVRRVETVEKAASSHRI